MWVAHSPFGGENLSLAPSLCGREGVYLTPSASREAVRLAHRPFGGETV